MFYFSGGVKADRKAGEHAIGTRFHYRVYGAVVIHIMLTMPGSMHDS